MTVQGTEEWFADRCGYVTASRYKDVLAKIKSGEAASRRNYRAQLVCERLTNRPADSYCSPEMQRGTELEPIARMAYEARTGAIVIETGFIKHASMMAGASPDGLIGDDGLAEFKCPNTATHIDTLINGMSYDHLPQVQGQMWITGRQWCDFVSFDPRLPEKMQLHIERIKRDGEYIAKLEKEITEFIKDVDQTIALLEKKAA